MRITVLLLLAFVALAGHPSPAWARESTTFISGGALQGEYQMAAADEDDFFRRLNVPPRLQVPPDPLPSGPSFTIRSPYWPAVLPGRDGERGRASETAAYFPDGGFVRARQPDIARGGELDSWLVLDLRQRAILERYLRLGASGSIPRQPGNLEVLRADALSGSPIGLQVVSAVLPAERARRFWQGLDADANGQVAKALLTEEANGSPVADLSDEFLTLTLTEGRSVRLQIIDSGGSLLLLFDIVGGHAYVVRGDAVDALLRLDGARPIPAGTVPQDHGTGSPLWWFIAGAAGIALLSTALYLARRWPRDAGSTAIDPVRE